MQLAAGVSGYTLRAESSASLLLVVDGEGVVTSQTPRIALRKGSVLFISAGLEVKVDCERSLLMFRAYCSL